MFGALTSLTGGGGMSASSSASNEQNASNQISTGAITIGGLNMGPPPSAIDSDMVLKVGGLVAIGVVAWLVIK